MGRGGKLEIVMDSIRLADGEWAALRATKEVQGGGHDGAMTAGIVVTDFLARNPIFSIHASQGHHNSEGNRNPNIC
jgi:hypothetical protein